MRVITSDRIDRWIRRTGIVALAALAWAVFVPGGVLWTAALAAAVIGSAVVTAVLVRRRPIPSLARVIASERSEPVVVPGGGGYRGGAGLRPKGDRKP
jgi:hypothetical protein